MSLQFIPPSFSVTVFLHIGSIKSILYCWSIFGDSGYLWIFDMHWSEWTRKRKIMLTEAWTRRAAAFGKRVLSSERRRRQLQAIVRAGMFLFTHPFVCLFPGAPERKPARSGPSRFTSVRSWNSVLTSLSLLITCPWPPLRHRWLNFICYSRGIKSLRYSFIMQFIMDTRNSVLYEYCFYCIISALIKNVLYKNNINVSRTDLNLWVNIKYT